MKITLVSFYAVTNIGDKILTECTKHILEQLGHTCNLLDIQGRCIINEADTDKTRLAKIKISQQRAGDEELLRNYFEASLQNSNAVIFAGGGIIDLLTEGVAKAIWILVNTANLLGIPVAFNAAGIFGHSFNNPNGKYIKQALMSPNVIWISLRERIDEIKQLLKGSKPCYSCCDTAVWAKEVYNITRTKESKSIGINIINDSAYKYHKKFNISNLNEFYLDVYNVIKGNGHSCFFFTNGVIKDYEYAQNFLKENHISQELLFDIQTAESGTSFLTMLSNFKLIISTRLHTSICSYSLQIPTLCLPWDEKMVIFYNSINKSYNIINDIEPDSLNKKIENALKQENTDNKQYVQYRQSVIDNITNMCETLSKS